MCASNGERCFLLLRPAGCQDPSANCNTVSSLIVVLYFCLSGCAHLTKHSEQIRETRLAGDAMDRRIQ